jgi:hypothetical protein
MMANKQPASGSGVLWGGGILWGGSILGDDTRPLWSGDGVRIGASNILKTTSDKWFFHFIDPYSMTDSPESTLAFGEAGQTKGLRVGPPNSWFYPRNLCADPMERIY